MSCFRGVPSTLIDVWAVCRFVYVISFLYLYLVLSLTTVEVEGLRECMWLKKINIFSKPSPFSLMKSFGHMRPFPNRQ